MTQAALGVGAVVALAGAEAVLGPGPVWGSAGLALGMVGRFGGSYLLLAAIVGLAVGIAQGWANGAVAGLALCMALAVLWRGTEHLGKAAGWPGLGQWAGLLAFGVAAAWVVMAPLSVPWATGQGLALLAGSLMVAPVFGLTFSPVWLAGGAALGLAFAGIGHGTGEPLLAPLVLLAGLSVVAALRDKAETLNALAGSAATAGLLAGADPWVSLGYVLAAGAVLAIAEGSADQRDRLSASEDQVARRTFRIRYLLRDRDEVTALAVHDLQSPIQAIAGLQRTLLHMIDTGKGEAAQMRPALEAAIATCLDLSDRIGSILSAKRPHLGGQGERAKVSALIDHTIAAHRLRIDKGGVTINRDVSADISLENGEEIKDVLDVLLDNALTYVPDGGRIDFAAAKEKGRLRLSISDDGPGVPETQRDDLFTRPKSAGGRQGMGLYLAARRLRALGGSLQYGTSDLGGAEFTIDLPPPTKADA